MDLYDEVLAAPWHILPSGSMVHHGIPSKAELQPAIVAHASARHGAGRLAELSQASTSQPTSWLACRRMRQNGKPKRDEYMRQIIDTKGVLNRLAINADETERDIIEEFEENQWESREAIKFAGQSTGALQTPFRACGAAG